MAQIGCLLWAIFFAVIAYSMMPNYITFVIIASAIFGLFDGYRKIKKEEKVKERERERLLNKKNDDFDPV